MNINTAIILKSFRNVKNTLYFLILLKGILFLLIHIYAIY